MRKLVSRRGETLVETLVAILIVTLASVLLLSGATAAARINRAARANDKKYEAQYEAAETAAAGTLTGTVLIDGAEVPVEFINNPSEELSAYRIGGDEEP